MLRFRMQGEASAGGGPLARLEPLPKGVHETDKKLEGKCTTVICMCKWSQVGDKFIRTFAFEIRPPVMVPELLKPMTSVCETL